MMDNPTMKTRSGRCGVRAATITLLAASAVAAAPVAAAPANGTTSLGFSTPEVSEGCRNTVADTVCEVSSLTGAGGLMGGYAHFASALDPARATSWADGYGGGLARASHKIPNRTRSVTYTATFQVVGYDDPRTAAVEAGGIKTSSAGLGDAFGRAQLDVALPGCSTNCWNTAVSYFARAQATDITTPDTLAPGEVRTVNLALSAPAGKSLPTGRATVLSRFEVFGVAHAQVPGNQGDASGAVRLIKLTATTGT